MRKIIFALMLAVVPVAAMADRQTMNTSDKVSVWMGKANANDEELYTGKANASCFASEDARSACFPGIPRTQWVFSDSAPPDLTKLWFDTDQVPGSVVLKVHNGTTWIQQAVGEGGSYILPTASVETKGGIKVGARLSIDGDGVLSADVQSGTGAVDSVNGNTGTVVLDADDIGDTSTTKKFVTATDLTKLSNLSGTNTGDQTTITGNAGSATVLQTARTIGGVSFNGSANINLPGVNATGNQNTTGTAAGLTAQYTDWSASSGGASIANKPTATTLTASIVTDLFTGTGDCLGSNGEKVACGSGGAISLLDMTDWPSGLTLAELGYVGDVTGPIQAQIDSLSAGGIPHVSSGYPSTSGAWNYNTTDNRLYTRKSNGDVYYTSALTLAAAADVTPEGFAFTDVTDATLSTQYTACDQVTSIDWPATVTASGGTAAICTSATYATDCGTFGTSPGTVANNGWVCARHTSSASNSTATNTAVTVGTVSDTFTTTTVSGSNYTDVLFNWGADNSLVADKGGITGTNSGAIFDSTNKIVGSHALSKDGNYDAVSFSITSSQFARSGGQIGGWVYTSTGYVAGSANRIFGITDGAGNTINLSINSSNSLTSYWYGNSNPAVVIGTTALSASTWYYVVLKYHPGDAGNDLTMIIYNSAGSVVQTVSEANIAAMTADPTALTFYNTGGDEVRVNVDNFTISNDIARDMWAVRNVTAF